MKKCLSLLLALILILGMLPFQAKAAPSEPPFPQGKSVLKPTDVGDNAYWEVEDNDSACNADVIYNDYTVSGGLGPYVQPDGKGSSSGGPNTGVIGLTHDGWDIDVSIYIVTISTGEQISVTIRF